MLENWETFPKNHSKSFSDFQGVIPNLSVKDCVLYNTRLYTDSFDTPKYIFDWNTPFRIDPVVKVKIPSKRHFSYTNFIVRIR